MSRILLRRGNKVDLPVLNAGEPGFATDTKELYIGASGGNAKVAMSAQEEWIPATLVNGWTSTDGVFYKKDDMNVVYVMGTITGGTAAQTAFNLPAGYLSIILLRILGIKDTDLTLANFILYPDGRFFVNGGSGTLSFAFSFKAG